MRIGFLLRFQEVTCTCSDDRTAKTHTFVDREKPDEGRFLHMASTRTITEVRREEGDNDPISNSFYVLPQ